MTTWKMPESMEQLAAMTMLNMRIEGYGPEVKTIAPCPFCAFPDWLCMPILDVSEAMKKGATCKQCGRSAKAIFSVERHDAKQFEIVQTGGDDPPAWFEPKMRRDG